MGIRETVAGWFTRSVNVNNGDPRLWSGPFLRTTNSGINVTDDVALRNAAAYACIRVISETIASLPLKLYKRSGKGKELAVNHPLYDLLHASPNSFMTSYEFFETLGAHVNLRGNFYGFKEITNDGELIGVVPLPPDQVAPKIDKAGVLYYEQQKKGEVIRHPSEHIWHVKGLSLDGIVGLSPVSQAKEAIGLSISLERHGSKLFKNDARPGGVLKTLKNLNEQAAKRLQERWQASYTGDNAWKIAVLEEGMEYQAIGFSNDDAQFLETRNFQIADIARMFRVPSILIGYADGAATYASVEQQLLSFVTHTIRPWLIRIEQSINKNLLTAKERKKYFAEFQLDGLLRGDLLSRYQAYQIARSGMWMSANEIRAKENMDPIEGGDEYMNPNTTPGDSTKPKSPDTGSGGKDDK